MASEKDYENVISHVNRIIENLNQHWSSIESLLNHVQKPLTVDDRHLAYAIQDARNMFKEVIFTIQTLDLTQTLNEIKFIGKRVNDIENLLKHLVENPTLKKEVKIQFSCDGYELVKKPIGYDKQDPIEEPNNDIKKLLDSLPKRLSLCLVYKFGLFGEKKRTFKEVAEDLGIEKERASQLVRGALAKCRSQGRKELVSRLPKGEFKKSITGEDS